MNDSLNHATNEFARSSKPGLDATKKLSGEGFKHAWPSPTKMDNSPTVKATGGSMFKSVNFPHAALADQRGNLAGGVQVIAAVQRFKPKYFSRASNRRRDEVAHFARAVAHLACSQ